MATSPLHHLLQTSFSQGVATDLGLVIGYLRHPRFPDREATFKMELRQAISQQTLSAADFERLTSIDQDSADDVVAFLIAELWEPLYGPWHGDPLPPGA